MYVRYELSLAMYLYVRFEMMGLCFSVQEENIIEHINVKCHVFSSVVNLLTIT
jgi:hypothetical protein